MRFLITIGTATVVAAALFAGASPAGDDTLLAVRSNPHQPTRTLLRVDARTLQPMGRTVTIGPTGGPYVKSPDGTSLAVGSGRALLLIDIVQMTKTRISNLVERGPLNVAAWPTPRRLIARVRDSAVVVDPVARKVLRTVRIRDAFSVGVATANGVAYLAAPARAIGAARVVSVDVAGRVRSVTLTRIRAGATWKRVNGTPQGRMTQPGFTVDRSRGLAYVVDASNVVAVVDLAAGSVTYHTLVRSEPRLARRDKEISGTWRAAEWVGNGRIGITGFDASGRASKPAGVAVVDTRDWTLRMLEPASAGFAHDGDAIVAWKGGGISAFSTDGTPRFSLSISDGMLYAQAFDGIGYVWAAKQLTLVDLRSGAVLRSMQRPPLYLLPAN